MYRDVAAFVRSLDCAGSTRWSAERIVRPSSCSAVAEPEKISYCVRQSLSVYVRNVEQHSQVFRSSSNLSQDGGAAQKAGFAATQFVGCVFAGRFFQKERKVEAKATENRTMVLCYAFDSGLLPDSFLALYLATTFLGIFNVGLFSQLSFHFLYKKATFIKWQYKSNAEFPKAKLVRHEAVRTIQGIFFSAIFPALAIYLAKKKAGGYGASDSDQGADSFLESKVLPKFQGYCGIDSSGEGMIRHLAEMLFIILVTDVYEWLYHNLGHELDFLWRFHTHHHKFFNPTPWAVIADEPPDQIMRSLPLLVLPFVFRMNVDVLFFTFAAFFYVYGIYLHSGYECDWIVRSDNPVVNTSFQHYMHHYAGGRKHACHTGFFFKFEDWVVGSYYKGDLTMEAQRPYYAINCRKGGKRKYADWERVAKKFPNYSVMYDWRFWLGEIGVKRYEEYFDREEVSVVDLTKAGGYSKEKEIDRVRKHVEGAVVE